MYCKINSLQYISQYKMGQNIQTKQFTFSPSLIACSQTMHTVLKCGTAHLHAQLDALPNVRNLLNKKLDRTQYRLSLKAYAKAHYPLEQKLIGIEKFLNLGNLPNYIPRLPSLFQDLLCQADEAPQHSYISTVSVPIEVSNISHYIGLRYVLEGASQGSRIIARHLEKSLPYFANQTFAFWNVQQQAAEQWPIYCNYISCPAKSPEYERQMLKAAQGAFECFIECFSNFEENI